MIPRMSEPGSTAEFTVKAVILGSIFGIIFGAATVYLALRAGLTVSASVPIAVLSIAVFKKLGKSTILENNIVQTIGSAGESIAAGVVFTLPALIFLNSPLIKRWNRSNPTRVIDEDTVFNRSFFYETPNRLKAFLNEENAITECIRLIDVATYRLGYHLELVMDDDNGISIAYLAQDR